MSISKRSSGRYQARIDLEPTNNGKRRRRALGTYRTRKDAERAERQALEARDRGIDVNPRSCTVSELLDRYLSDREALGRGKKTLQEYRGCADRLIRPHLGGILVSKLRPANVSEWVANLLRRGGVKNRPLSAKSTRHAFMLLNGAVRFAIRMELMARNPCDAVSRPTVQRSQARALKPDEITRILTAAQGSRWEQFVTLALATGCRRGELCALSWNDYDAANATLTIRASLAQTRDGISLKATKTGLVRTLALSEIAVRALRSQRVLQAEERLASGGHYENSDDAVFADQLGRRVTPMATSCAFARLARKAGISTTRLHDCRHTAATTLLVSGVDVRTTAGILGHSAASTTLNLYGHLMADAQRDAAERLGERLRALAP